ncbi:MAG: diguanylate cyclase [Gammaproteobacteria bacterium]|jgi:diguanylate cyclase (GGDEF)-like protein|nr:diguanylate cyclase [Gammaproteobacteria bacterium]
MEFDNHFFFRLRQHRRTFIIAYAAAMLIVFPYIPPQIAALGNLGLVVLANLLGFWRWGLAATAWTVLVTWLMDTFAWQVGFGPSVYLVGGLFNLGMTLIFGTALAAKNRQMISDGLTGLYNDHHFRMILDWEVTKARRYRRPLALVMIDLDHFKPLNDRYGHPVGDQVLKDLAAIIDRTRRESDLAARYGGDEFALILPETGMKGAAEMIDRLRHAIADHDWSYDGETLDVRASLGAAAMQSGQTSGQLLREADQALYADKHERRQAFRPDESA